MRLSHRLVDGNNEKFNYIRKELHNCQGYVCVALEVGNTRLLFWRSRGLFIRCSPRSRSRTSGLGSGEGSGGSGVINWSSLILIRAICHGRVCWDGSVHLIGFPTLPHHSWFPMHGKTAEWGWGIARSESPSKALKK